MFFDEKANDVDESSNIDFKVLHAQVHNDRQQLHLNDAELKERSANTTDKPESTLSGPSMPTKAKQGGKVSTLYLILMR